MPLLEHKHRWAKYDERSAECQFAAGWTLTAIAKAQGCSRATVHRRLAEAGLVQPHRWHGRRWGRRDG